MISVDLLDKIYGNKIDLDILLSTPKSDQDLVENYLPSKLWRLNNLYTIVNKDGERIRFSMNYAQHRVYAHQIAHKRSLILKSRQQGISTFFLINYVDDLIFVDDLNIGMMAQGDTEAKTLLRRAKLGWNNFPQCIKDFLTVSRNSDNTTELSLSNNSSMFCRTSFRSTTLQRLHISEFGKIANENPSRAEETITGTLQAIKAGNPVAIESTAEGDNLFKQMWDTAVERLEEVTRQGKQLSAQDFYPIFLSWLDDPDCNSDEEEIERPDHTAYFNGLEKQLNRIVTKTQRNFWIAKLRELGGKIFQEYPATPDEAFQKTKDGSYYARAYKEYIRANNREIMDLHDHNLPVHVAIDLGMSDSTVLAFFQVFKGEIRIIHEYYNSGESLAFYDNYIRTISATRNYTIEWIVGPHDMEVTELTSGKSRRQRLFELGWTKIKVLPRYNLMDGIERVRKAIPNMFIDASCTYLIGCMVNYSKEWDDVHEVWKVKPLHDKWSHGADTIRYMVLADFQSNPYYWNSIEYTTKQNTDFNNMTYGGDFAV